jgi:hypothetical protein
MGLLLATFAATAQNVRTYIPKNAYTYLPVLKEEIYRIIPDTPLPEYFGGLAEQESCLSLTHSKCWLPTSRLLTSREEGGGIFQLTRAYRPDGTLRFDSLSEARLQWRTELKDLTWENLYSRPDLQIRTMLLMVRKDLNYFSDAPPPEQYKFADSAYNGGRSDVVKSRAKCSLTKGCDSNVWFDNVEKVSVKSDKPIYGTRSAKFINNEHVENIFKLRMHKYKPYLSQDPQQ